MTIQMCPKLRKNFLVARLDICFWTATIYLMIINAMNADHNIVFRSVIFRTSQVRYQSNDRHTLSQAVEVHKFKSGAICFQQRY